MFCSLTRKTRSSLFSCSVETALALHSLTKHSSEVFFPWFFHKEQKGKKIMFSIFWCLPCHFLSQRGNPGDCLHTMRGCRFLSWLEKVTNVPGSVYTSRKSPAAIEKLGFVVSDNSMGFMSGKVTGRVWSSLERLLLFWWIHGYTVYTSVPSPHLQQARNALG